MSVITLLAINAKLFQYWENLFFTQDLVMFLLIFLRIKKGGGAVGCFRWASLYIVLKIGVFEIGVSLSHLLVLVSRQCSRGKL